MSVLHLAVAYDDVLAWLVPESSIVVASALHGDTVITGVEEAVFDEHTVAIVDVNELRAQTVLGSETAFLLCQHL